VRLAWELPCAFGVGAVGLGARGLVGRVVACSRQHHREHVEVVQLAELLLEVLELLDHRLGPLDLPRHALEQVAHALGGEPRLVRLLGRRIGVVAGGAQRGVRGQAVAERGGAVAQPRRHHRGEARRGTGRVAGECDARPQLVAPQVAQQRGERLRDLLPHRARRLGVGVALGRGQPGAQPQGAGTLARVHARALRIEPGDLDLEVAPGVGAAGRPAQPLRLALPHAPRELGPVRRERAPQPAHGHAEVVQRLGVVGVVEPRAGGRGARREVERDEARALLGDAGQQVVGEARGAGGVGHGHVRHGRSLVVGLRPHVHRAVEAVGDGHPPRAAAHRAVLDVLLVRAAARVDGHLARLAAVRAVDHRRAVGHAVAEREGVVELRVVVAEVVGVARGERPVRVVVRRPRRRRGAPPSPARRPRRPRPRRRRRRSRRARGGRAAATGGGRACDRTAWAAPGGAEWGARGAPRRATGRTGRLGTRTAVRKRESTRPCRAERVSPAGDARVSAARDARPPANR
jgi:hypothetical protein